MSQIQENKNIIRKKFLQTRFALSLQQVQDYSQEIANNFITNLLPNLHYHNKTFSLYIPAYNEALTNQVAEHFKSKQISFSYPKIIDKFSPLKFIKFEENQNFQPNNIFSKILEPQGIKEITPDFLIIPLVAFDAKMSRIGMGGGFYDRTIEALKNQNLKIITIGLAYDFQYSLQTLPCENSDQSLDFIVSQQNIFSKSPAFSS